MTARLTWLDLLIAVLLLASVFLLGAGCGYTFAFNGDIASSGSLQEDPVPSASSTHTVSTTDATTATSIGGVSLPSPQETPAP